MEKREEKEQVSCMVSSMQDGAHVAKRGPSMKSEKYERIGNIIFSSILRRQMF